jgi:NADPH:quinone reductase-like Zn-dependent oxidoreductase
MKAYLMDAAALGGIRLADAPEPQPKAHEALIAVEAFSLNRGELPGHGMFAEDTIPGWDSAGRVAVAAADGSGPKAGARVVGFMPGGAWAQHRAVATANLATLPDGADAERASALPVAAGTALRALRTLGASLGRRVLVTGASGGVGRLAVQLGRRAGAYVIASTSSEQNRKELTLLGADEVVTDLAQLDVPVYGVIDTVGGQTLVGAWGHLTAGGMLVSIGYAGETPATFPPYGTVGPRKTLVAFTLGTALLPNESLGDDFAFLAGLLAKGELDPQVTWRGNWTQLPEAIGLFASRKISGKAVLTVS